MSVTKASRDINQLHPVAQAACRLFLAECKKAGINIFITETYRSQARQNYLYAQGRTRPGQVVTWTLNSNHKSKLAWDIAVSPPKSLYDVATLNKAGAIARSLGITWGGDWRPTIDRPHFEVKTSWKAPVQAAATPNKKEEIVLFNSGSSTINKEVIASIVAARKAGILTADTYVIKAQNGTLTLQELTAINTLILKRAYLNTIK